MYYAGASIKPYGINGERFYYLESLFLTPTKKIFVVWGNLTDHKSCVTHENEFVDEIKEWCPIIKKNLLRLIIH